MFDGSDNCWVPDVPTDRADTWRLKVAKFGDGYSQRTLDGINPLDKQWSVSFVNRTAECINEMVDYLESQKAAAFNYLEQQTGIMYRVFCDSWSVNWAVRRSKGHGNPPVYIGTLTATFVKANGATV